MIRPARHTALGTYSQTEEHEKSPPEQGMFATLQLASKQQLGLRNRIANFRSITGTKKTDSQIANDCIALRACLFAWKRSAEKGSSKVGSADFEKAREDFARRLASSGQSDLRRKLEEYGADVLAALRIIAYENRTGEKLSMEERNDVGSQLFSEPLRGVYRADNEMDMYISLLLSVAGKSALGSVLGRLMGRVEDPLTLIDREREKQRSSWKTL